MTRIPTVMHRFAWRTLLWTIALAIAVAFFLGKLR